MCAQCHATALVDEALREGRIELEARASTIRALEASPAAVALLPEPDAVIAARNASRALFAGDQEQAYVAHATRAFGVSKDEVI